MENIPVDNEEHNSRASRLFSFLFKKHPFSTGIITAGMTTIGVGLIENMSTDFDLGILTYTVFLAGAACSVEVESDFGDRAQLQEAVLNSDVEPLQ